MRIYEYGKENPECILLIHPSLVTWDYFENVISLLGKDYHLLIPALPGYDLQDDSEFSSVERIASELADALLQKGIHEVKAIYDAIVIDILWLCHSKAYILPGTEDMTAAYHDYGYHVKSTCVGMLIGLPVCLVIGLVVQVISWIAA